MEIWMSVAVQGKNSMVVACQMGVPVVGVMAKLWRAANLEAMVVTSHVG